MTPVRALPLVLAFCLCALPAFAQVPAGQQVSADAFAGGDIGARWNAAYASVLPGPSAEIHLRPGQVYAVTTTMVVGSGIRRPVTDCHGSTLRWAGAAGGAMVRMMGANAQAPGETGGFVNCRFDSGGVRLDSLIEVRGRLGFLMERNFFEGEGTVNACVAMVNATGSGGPDYQEDWAFNWNGWSNCKDGIAMHRGSKGADSFDYGWLVGNHWQLGGGQHGLHIFGDEGNGPLNVQGLHVSGTTNTAGGAGEVDTVLVDPGSVLLSAFLELSGENTGANSWFDVSGSASFTGSIHTRGSSGIKNGANPTPQVGIVPGKNDVPFTGSLWQTESPPNGIQEAQSKLAVTGQSFDFWGANNGGFDPTQLQLHNCKTQPAMGMRDVFSKTVPCINAMRWTPGVAVEFGAGWGDIGGQPAVYAPPSGQYGTTDVAAHGVEVVAPTGSNGTTMAYGVKGQLDGSVVEYTFNTKVNAAVVGGPSGVAATGSCTIAVGTVITYVNGRITGCR